MQMSYTIYSRKFQISCGLMRNLKSSKANAIETVNCLSIEQCMKYCQQFIFHFKAKYIITLLSRSV